MSLKQILLRQMLRLKIELAEKLFPLKSMQPPLGVAFYLYTRWEAIEWYMSFDKKTSFFFFHRSLKIWCVLNFKFSSEVMSRLVSDSYLRRNMGPAMQKGIFGLMWTTKAQISWYPLSRTPVIPVRKHAYSNILKILPPMNEHFQIKNSDIFYVSAQNIDCRYSLEPLRRGGSNGYP